MKNRYNVEMQWSDVILKELRYECREIIPTQKKQQNSRIFSRFACLGNAQHRTIIIIMQLQTTLLIKIEYLFWELRCEC